MFRQAFLALALALSVGLCNGCAIPNSVNPAALNLIKGAEALVPSPAPDPIGLLTVGYGHLCKTKRCSEVPHPFPLTTSTANSLLESDLKTFISCVYNDIHPSVKLNDNQFGALVSWAFNVG
ncbi:lysozyme-like protein, partial [Agrocybe pediades]